MINHYFFLKFLTIRLPKIIQFALLMRLLIIWMAISKHARKGGGKSGVDEEVKPFKLLCQVYSETTSPNFSDI